MIREISHVSVLSAIIKPGQSTSFVSEVLCSLL